MRVVKNILRFLTSNTFWDVFPQAFILCCGAAGIFLGFGLNINIFFRIICGFIFGFVFSLASLFVLLVIFKSLCCLEDYINDKYR